MNGSCSWTSSPGSVTGVVCAVSGPVHSCWPRSASHSWPPRRGRPVGDVMLQALQSLAATPGAEDVLRSFVLLGDPATRLGLPLVPVAQIKPLPELLVGEPATLEGSGSDDPAENPLSYAWAVVAEPIPGAGQIQDSGDPARPRFAGLAPGEYTVQLSVTAGGQTSAPAVLGITVVPRAPGLGCSGSDQPAYLSALDLWWLAIPLLASPALTRRQRNRSPQRR